MQILDLDEVDELPFSVLARWYDAELETPFLDRRLEMTAFLVCRVLASVIHSGVTPTRDMFELTPKPGEESAPEDDFPKVDQASIDSFAGKIEQWNAGKYHGGGGG